MEEQSNIGGDGDTDVLIDNADEGLNDFALDTCLGQGIL